MSLDGKVGLLFGAGAIAPGYARLFLKEGMNLVIVSRPKNNPEDISSDKLVTILNPNTGREAVAFHADASKFAKNPDDPKEQAGLQEAYNFAVKKFGRIDVVINGSGGNEPSATVHKLDDFVNMDPEAPLKVMINNLMSKRYSIQLFAKYLQNAGHQGSVVNIASMSGITPLSKVGDYSIANGGLQILTSWTADLYARYGLGRVNSVAVGFSEGAQNRHLLRDKNNNYTPRAAEIIASTSMGRFLSTEEISPHVLYLADPAKSAQINGHTLRVDLGFGLVNLPITGYKDTKTK